MGTATGHDTSAGAGKNGLTALILIRAAALAISCAISFIVITRILAKASVSRDDNMLGGMWAVAATIFVFRYSQAESLHAALSRMAATGVSFALCLGYLLLFPFQLWGMAVLIGLGAIVISILGRPDDAITTGITTAVIMVVAALSPEHAWRQPFFRLLDTAVGVSVGLAMAWVSAQLAPSRR